MIVYVESNFLLELAYQQETHSACQQLLDLAANDQVSLVVPAFAMAEARLVWNRRASERRAFQDQLQPLIRELSRSQPFQALRDSSRELISALVASGEDTRSRLEAAIDQVGRVGSVLPLDLPILAAARQSETELGFRPPDAIVYASVLSHAAGDPDVAKVFINRDSKDFADPNIYDELAKSNCKVIVSFEDGLQYVSNTLKLA